MDPKTFRINFNLVERIDKLTSAIPIMNPIEFIHNLYWDQIPSPVQYQVKRCLLDTIGTAIGGRKTNPRKLSMIFPVTLLVEKELF